MPTVEHDTQTASLLEQIDSLRSFTRQVAHDLRGPLVSVVCAAEHAQQALAGGDTRIAGQMLHLLATHAAGLHELVLELLALAHAGETPLCRAPIDMTALARSAAEQARLICNAGDSVAVQLLPLPTACGTEPLLRQVFVNLVCNAMKFTRHVEHPRIEIGWEPGNGGCAFFYVRDNGIGFDPRHAQRLFEPFSRLHGNDYPGHGIGLSIVRRVVERHGGRAWAAPGVPRGATFYFTLATEVTASVANG